MYYNVFEIVHSFALIVQLSHEPIYLWSWMGKENMSNYFPPKFKTLWKSAPVGYSREGIYTTPSECFLFCAGHVISS